MGKMKDISIELEEAGLDPFDNSNLQGYVDDTHHFGEDVLTGGFDAPLSKCVIVNPPVTINEQYGAYGTESDVGTDLDDFELWTKYIIGREPKPWEKAVITHNRNNPVICPNADQNGTLEKLKAMTGPSRVRKPNYFGIDLASGPDLTSLGSVTENADGSLNFDMESGCLFSRHMIVNGRQMGKSFMFQQIGRALRPITGKRYSYSGRLAKGRLHYDVIDCHTREVVNTYRQIKKAKALVKELNRG